MHHIMSFNESLKVDFAEWKHADMERENNLREMKVEAEQPKFGAGSEYMREQREEFRRKKYGINANKYKPGKMKFSRVNIWWDSRIKPRNQANIAPFLSFPKLTQMINHGR